jgi:dTDP-4-dehydrorhamnose reductase
MLGRAVTQRLEELQVQHTATGSEVDVRSISSLRSHFKSHRPDVIINCSAYTRVDDAESDKEAAYDVNAKGPTNLGRIASEYGAAVLHVSTDYVFSGDSSEPWQEDALVGPVNVYGETKLVGELGLHSECDRRWVVRTSWLFGDGPNFVATMLQLMRKENQLKIVADQVGRPTYVPDLADALVKICGVHGEAVPFGVYHFANGGAVSWYEFAEEIAAISRGLGDVLAVERIDPVASSEFPRPARRPSYSVLDTSKVERFIGNLRLHTEALTEYIEKRR